MLFRIRLQLLLRVCHLENHDEILTNGTHPLLRSLTYVSAQKYKYYKETEASLIGSK
jgi:hypothetical protein